MLVRTSIRLFVFARVRISRDWVMWDQGLSTVHTSTLDVATLESCSNERSFWLDVCESFLAEAPDRIQDLKSALHQEDMQVLIQTAHALKSLSSCIGAMRLFKICQFVEAAGREGGDMAASAVLEQIETEYEYLQLAIQDYKNAH